MANVKLKKADATRTFKRGFVPAEQQDTAPESVVNAYYREAKRSDRPKVSFEWSCYVDGLHRDGQITDHQAHIWLCP